MAQFYASIKGNRGEATRMGSKESGMQGHIRGWHIGGQVYMGYDKEKDEDTVTLSLTTGSHGYANNIYFGTYRKSDLELLKKLPAYEIEKTIRTLLVTTKLTGQEAST